MAQCELFQAIKNSQNSQAKKLAQALFLQLQQLLDTENATLLHIACDHGNYQMAEYLLQAYDNKMYQGSTTYTTESKKKWINKKDNQGFTSIHYAVFRHNGKLALLLQKHGADIYAINNQGLNLLHIAAQGGSIFLMVMNALCSQYYYMTKGIKIDSTDEKGSTALHWACYTGVQQAVYALLSWGASINAIDTNHGMTPLHLAVLSGNGRIVRKLLIKGCDRNIKNFKGKLPLDLAIENEYATITEMIRDRMGILELLNIKTPFRQVRVRAFPFFFFLIVLLIAFVFNVSFVIFQSSINDIQMILAIIFLIFSLITFILFVVNCKMDPGRLYQNSNISEFDMLRKNHPQSICFQCKIIKPQRSKHCQICKSCISVYDHHCPWIGNCVGSKNYLLFFVFLSNLWFYMLYTIAFEIVNLLNITWNNLSIIQKLRIFAIGVSLGISLLFIIPLTYLIIVQCQNSFLNKTTFQRYGYQGKPKEKKMKQIKENLISKRKTEFTIYDFESDASTSKADSQRREQSERQIEYPSDKYQNCFKMCCANANNPIYFVQQQQQ